MEPVPPAPAPVETADPTSTPSAAALDADRQLASRVEAVDPIGQWAVAILVLLLAIAVGVVIRLQLRIDRRPES